MFKRKKTPEAEQEAKRPASEVLREFLDKEGIELIVLPMSNVQYTTDRKAIIVKEPIINVAYKK